MAQRRRRRSRSESPNGRRRGRPPLSASSGSSSTGISSSSFGSSDAQAVLTRVAQLVQENQALARENNELKSALSQIAETMQLTVATAPAPLSDGLTAAASVGGAGNGRRRRRGRRGQISDPSTLERRRAALAKARAVLAAKRAAAKRARPA